MPNSIVADLADMLGDTITVESLTSTGGGIGASTYSSPVVRQARVSGRIRRVNGLDGRERVSTVTAIVAGAFGIKIGDRITLPSRFVPNQPEIIGVQHQTDENGAHHETVYFA